jgi:hypothetical protein
MEENAMIQQTNLGYGFQIVDEVFPQSEMRSSPGHQARLALRSGFRLRPTTFGANNEMMANCIKSESTISSAAGMEGLQHWIKQRCAHLINPARERTAFFGKFRTIDRLLLSLWISLPFLLLVSSDWIGMVIVWQGLSAAYRLSQTVPTRLRSNRSNVASINEGQSA